MLCKQSFSHWTFTEVGRSPTSLCESGISEKWVVAIRCFCYVLFQLHYIQQKFYDINFLSLSHVCCKTLFLFGRILPFPGKKIRTTVEYGNDMGLLQEEEMECRNIQQEDFLAPCVPLVYFWGWCSEHTPKKKNSIDSTMAAKGLTQVVCILSSKNVASSQIKVVAVHACTVYLLQKTKLNKWIFFTLSMKRCLLEISWTREKG